MNAKQVIAILSLAVAGNAAFAVEAEQWVPAASTAARADVKADIGVANGTLLMSGGEATVFVDGPVASLKSREEVRAEARQAARDLSFDELYAA